MIIKALCAALAALAFASAAHAQALPTLSPAPEGATPDELLATVATPSRHVATLVDGRLVGEGGDFLRARTAGAQFVLFGEDHGNAHIADLATALWRDLSTAGFRYAAIEADPWNAAALEAELRGGGIDGWARLAEVHGGAASAPFYTWANEARFAQAVVAASDTRPALWGVDQVFIGSTPWLLRRIAAEARTPEARTLAAELAQSSAGSLEWLGQSDEAQLRRLHALLSGRRDAELARLVDAMIVSQRIYRPFTGGDGETWPANDEREDLMKRNFLATYEAAARRDRAPPRVMLKFGANHMYRGASPTMVQALGGFVTELAARENRSTVSIYTVCGPGSFNAMLVGPPNLCDSGFAEDWSFLAPFIERDKLTLFDLRVWRLRPRRWRHLSGAAQQAIASFDVLIVLPNGPPEPFLPGLTPPPAPPAH